MEVPAAPPLISPDTRFSAAPVRADRFCFSTPGSPARARGAAPGTECRLVEVRGLRVASFRVDGQELICLPQLFQLFLKQRVGGLHTVYTKLKRLRARPVVCTVEQVRVLRGIGAIQPGVNRCKLISRADFEALYNDCTSASSRPGRPPKRSQIPQHRSPVLLSPSPRDLTFKMASHPLLPVHLPRTSVALVLNHMNHLNTLATMVSSARVQSSNSKPVSVIKKERSEDTVTSGVDGVTECRIDYKHKQWSIPSSTLNPTNIYTPQRASLNSSEEHREGESGFTKVHVDTVEKSSVQSVVPGFPAAFLYADSSSVETLLINIQGLLKVALENTRVQEKQLQQERRELKLELYREREIRERLERQLSSEQHSRASLQRRLKKEKKAKRRLQEALQFEFRRRERVERAFQQSASHLFQHGDEDGLSVEVDYNSAREETLTLQEKGYRKTLGHY